MGALNKNPQCITRPVCNHTTSVHTSIVPDETDGIRERAIEHNARG